MMIPNGTRDNWQKLERASNEACDSRKSRGRVRKRRKEKTTTTSLVNGDDNDDDDVDNALTVSLAFHYSGRADILSVATKLTKSIVEDAAARSSSSSSTFFYESNPPIIDETQITKRLCTSNLPDVDLIIRTRSERRLTRNHSYRLKSQYMRAKYATSMSRSDTCTSYLK